MVYTHEDWKLYEMDVDFTTIGRRKSYFFSKKTPKRGTPCDMPKGYEIVFNKKTNMPLLKFAGNKVSVYQQRKHGQR